MLEMNKIMLGDLLALLTTTLIGFITHREADLSFAVRFAAIYLPLSILWLLVAPRLGLFRSENTSSLKQLWRVPLAMLVVVPVSVLVRAWVLQTPVIPIFMLALGGTSTLGMMTWRGLYFFLGCKPKHTSV